MVGLIIGFTVYPNACTPKLAATLDTEFSCSSHLPTYIEMTANGGQVKSSSFMLPSWAGAFRWHRMAFWVPFPLWTNKLLHDLVLKLETAVKKIAGIM